MDRPGLFIAIEGTDSRQESDQFSLLCDQLTVEGYDVAAFSFPRLGQPSGHFVEEYLSGNYGSIEAVGPYTGALFYALDRYQAAADIRHALTEGKVVLVQGFSGSSMAHQGSLFKHPEERRGFFIWLDNMEFQMLGIPRPDKNIVLRSSKTADIPGLVRVYDDLCQLFPKDFARIDCERGDQTLEPQIIHKLVRETVEPLLPTSPGRSVSVDNLKYKYFTPPELNTAARQLYTQKMDEIGAAYAEMIQKLTLHLQDQAQAIKILKRVLPVSALLERSSEPVGVNFIAKSSGDQLASIAHKHLVSQLAPPSKSVDLVSVQPRNELELVADILYQQSNLSLRDIRAEVSEWSYEQKAAPLETYLDSPNLDPIALDRAVYSLDMLTSFETFSAFVDLKVGQGLAWQQLTPRYGYKMPDSIDEAGLSDLFEYCFDTSVALYSKLQEAGFAPQAQYATLIGHRVRWEINCSLREVLALQKLELDNPGLRKLAGVIKEKIAEVHPILGARLAVD